MDKITDVVEDITEAATSTLKNAAGALFGLGSAAASTLSGGETEETVTEQVSEKVDESTTLLTDGTSGSIVDDITAVSEIIDEEKEKDS